MGQEEESAHRARDIGRRIFGAEPVREVEDELSFHVTMRTRELMAEGMSEADARERALLRFGSVEAAREECLTIAERRQRNMARAEYLQEFVQDARYALRGLRRQPAFAAGVVLALMLGIGLSTAVFSVVDAVAIRPLPYEQPGELVRLWEVERAHPDRTMNVALPTLVDWSNQSRAFSALGATSGDKPVLSGRGDPTTLQGAVATAGLATVLGVRPQLGRWFSAQEDRPGGEAVVVLGHALWQQRFGADTGVLGMRIMLDGESSTVIGVMPAGFDYPDNAEFWRPLNPRFADFATVRGARFNDVIGRVRTGVDLNNARADLQRVADAISRAVPDNAEYGATLSSMTEVVVGAARPRLLLLLTSVLLLLLIACANVAGLLLARSATRLRELSVRSALGASRARLVRQLATESLMLGVLGGVAGVALAWFLVPLLVRASPVDLPRVGSVSVNGRVLLFATGVSMLAALIFGLWPAFRLLSRVPRGDASARVIGRSIGSARAHSAIVIGELALSFVLVTSAAMLFRGFVQLVRTDPGFKAEQLTTFRLQLKPYRAKEHGWNGQSWEEITRLLEQVPGVAGVSGSNNPPVSGTSMQSPIAFEGRKGTTDEPAQVSAVLPSYFETMGMRVVNGRGFTWRDTYNSKPVIIVNETFARRYFAGVNPIGKRIRSMFGPLAWPEIIGVIGDVRHTGQATSAPLQVFVPSLQPIGSTSAMTFVLRSALPLEVLMPGVRAAVHAFDAEMPIDRIATMETLLGRTIALPRFLTAALAVFSALALGLALLGVYSVMAYIVARRANELGVRMAIGASPADILKLILHRATMLAGAGVLLGLIGAYFAMRVVQRLVFAAERNEPLVLLIGVGVLAAGVVLASLPPARRATRINPAAGLRAD